MKLFAISPRHFECAMTKTCQVLVEGDYQGVLEPGRHYIELKRDYSNLDEVIEKIQDRELCEQIAERAYEEVVASGKYTYRLLAEQVAAHLPNQLDRSLVAEVCCWVGLTMLHPAMLSFWAAVPLVLMRPRWQSVLGPK